MSDKAQRQTKTPTTSTSSAAPVQSKMAQRRLSEGTELPIAPSLVHEVLRSPGQPLDKGTRAVMEPRFGHDFSQVRVHTDAQAAESAQAVNALAYTVGRDVVFGRGQYAPHTNTGRRLMAHELTHVVQQNAAIWGTQFLEVLSDDASEQEAQALSEHTAQQTSLARGHHFTTSTSVHNKTWNQRLQRQPSPQNSNCANMDQAVGNWILSRVFNKIIEEYSTPVGDRPPSLTRQQIWKWIARDGEQDIDFFFQVPGQPERHVKLIVRLTNARTGTVAVASLYDWLGPIPVEFAHWEGAVTRTGNTCTIQDLPPPPVPEHQRRSFPGDDEGETSVV
ncbi:MAG TPA: DUF4157 domain-containing protein [Ktedonobacterales bacterium]